LEHAPRDPDDAVIVADLHPELHGLLIGVFHRASRRSWRPMQPSSDPRLRLGLADLEHPRGRLDLCPGAGTSNERAG
jgi:hypothetical protein